MKTIYTTIIALLISILAYSQTPSTFKYQAVIRDANGVVLANESVKLTVKVLPKTGSEVYSEIHEVQTNQYGLVNLEIGSKNTTKFSQINWSQGGFKLAVELGNVLIGTNDILTVPYALHANTAESLTNPPSEIDPDYNTSHAANITENDITNLRNLSGTNTGDQTLASILTKNSSAGSNKITNLANPASNQDAATKAYVDALKIMVLNLQAEIGVTDERDGIHYEAIRIGDQVWMAENLKYLPSVIGPATQSATIPYYYVYAYNGTSVSAAKATINYDTYGVLYNWTAAMNSASYSYKNPSGVQGVCPSGWHLPSKPEWEQLADFLGGESIAGGKLKHAGTTYWNSPNTSGTNATGFTAMPGGFLPWSSFSNLNKNGYLWTTTEGQESTSISYIILSYNSGALSIDDGWPDDACSVRCVKD